ncbi:MAG: glycosyltransferase family 39 protein [Acidobacteria bacterium]|nr:glycosyltransferase family 39 protein [Acidobacteriota bacterium]
MKRRRQPAGKVETPEIVIEPPRARGDLLALAMAVPLVVPFLQPGWFFGHNNMHLIRLFEQDVMIRAGQFPVRWYPDVAAGYGSPHPQFYAPLFYWVAQIFLFAGLSLAGALKAAVAAVVLATSWTTYRWARAWFGEPAALVAAAALDYAPYHMLDLFVRTAFSELMVFIFLPLTFLMFHRLAERTTPGRVAAAAVALSGLCLSHTVTTMLVPPLVGGCIVLEAWARGWNRRVWLGSAAALVGGVLLAAFFLVPLVAEKGAIDTDIYAAGYFDYHKHFAAPGQLIHSPWGFGLSREGDDDGVSFRLGVLQIAGAALFLWRRPWRSASRAARAAMILAGGIAAAGIVMALPISSPVWALVGPLRYAQFPWRFLMLSAMGLAFLGGAAVDGAAPPEDSPGPGAARRRPASAAGTGIPLWGAGVLATVILVSSFGMFGFRERIALDRIGFGGDHTDMRERGAADATASPTVFTREFVRAETLHWFDHLPPGGYPYPPREDLRRPRAEIDRGKARIEMIESGPVTYRMRLQADAPSLLRLNVYRFPGWSWTLDGAEAAAATFPSKRPILALEIPAGEHEAVANYRKSVPRLIGDVTSLVALAIVAALALAGVRSRRPSP